MESKLLEPLGKKKAAFAPAYDDLAPRFEGSPWYDLLLALRREPCRFQHLDAAQLIKHYLGLRQRYRGKVTLLYLYWEPLNAADFLIYAVHRREIEKFRELIVGGDIRFEAQSYAQLWESWSDCGAPTSLPAHLGQLLNRYVVRI